MTNTDTQSYVNHTSKLMLKRAENEKKKEYSKTCEESKENFTPLCISVDRLLGSETRIFFKRLNDHLGHKWQKSYSKVVEWVKARLLSIIFRAAILRQRWAQTKRRSWRWCCHCLVIILTYSVHGLHYVIIISLLCYCFFLSKLLL